MMSKQSCGWCTCGACVPNKLFCLHPWAASNFIPLQECRHHLGVWKFCSYYTTISCGADILTTFGCKSLQLHCIKWIQLMGHSNIVTSQFCAGQCNAATQRTCSKVWRDLYSLSWLVFWILASICHGLTIMWAFQLCLKTNRVTLLPILEKG